MSLLMVDLSRKAYNALNTGEYSNTKSDWLILKVGDLYTTNSIPVSRIPQLQRYWRNNDNKSSAVAEMGDRGHNSVGCHSSAL